MIFNIVTTNKRRNTEIGIKITMLLFKAKKSLLRNLIFYTKRVFFTVLLFVKNCVWSYLSPLSTLTSVMLIPGHNLWVWANSEPERKLHVKCCQVKGQPHCMQNSTMGQHLVCKSISPFKWCLKQEVDTQTNQLSWGRCGWRIGINF